MDHPLKGAVEGLTPPPNQWWLAIAQHHVLTKWALEAPTEEAAYEIDLTQAHYLGEQFENGENFEIIGPYPWREALLNDPEAQVDSPALTPEQWEALNLVVEAGTSRYADLRTGCVQDPPPDPAYPERLLIALNLLNNLREEKERSSNGTP